MTRRDPHSRRRVGGWDGEVEDEVDIVRGDEAVDAHRPQAVVLRRSSFRAQIGAGDHGEIAE